MDLPDARGKQVLRQPNKAGVAKPCSRSMPVAYLMRRVGHVLIVGTKIPVPRPARLVCIASDVPRMLRAWSTRHPGSSAACGRPVAVMSQSRDMHGRASVVVFGVIEQLQAGWLVIVASVMIECVIFLCFNVLMRTRWAEIVHPWGPDNALGRLALMQTARRYGNVQAEVGEVAAVITRTSQFYWNRIQQQLRLYPVQIGNLTVSHIKHRCTVSYSRAQHHNASSVTRHANAAVAVQDCTPQQPASDTSLRSFCSNAPLCYTEKAPNAWHR